MKKIAYIVFICTLAIFSTTFAYHNKRIRANQKIVKTFYEALNAKTPETVRTLAEQVLDVHWVDDPAPRSSGSSMRNEFINLIVTSHKMIPNLHWDVKKMYTARNENIIVRSIVTGTLAVDSFDIKGSAGKSFKMMAIDIHKISHGKIVYTYHVENWLSVINQLNK